MGGDNGFLSLVTQPDIKSYIDPKGKTVSVDAMTTGYAFVLFDLLKRNGLKPAQTTKSNGPVACASAGKLCRRASTRGPC